MQQDAGRKRRCCDSRSSTRGACQEVYVFAIKSFKDTKKGLGLRLADHEVSVVSRPGFAEGVVSANVEDLIVYVRCTEINFRN